MKKILIVLVLFCWVSLWDCHPIYAEETIKGNCGESVFWEYSNGLLRIYGNGEMKTNPWMNYKDCRENLRKVIIDEGVTAVCEKAFNTTKGDSLDYDYMAEGVFLPDTLEGIGEMAFAFSWGLKEIDIPAGVKSIGEGAFAHSPNLQTVTFSSGCKLEKVEAYTFSGCSGLENIVLPEGISYIGDGAFTECRSLKKINLPDSVSKIGKRLFYECYLLERIKIPDGITSIPTGMFIKCYHLTKVEMSNNIKKIGSYAFSFCSSLEKVNIPSELGEVGKQAFIYCAAIEELNLPDTLTRIGEDAFEGCCGLKRIRFPQKLKEIPPKMLYDCTGLKKINIPATVTKIGKNAFGGCASLRRLVIPPNVKKIDPCHQDCPGLKEILNKSKVTYSLSASELVMNWYQGKKRVTEVKPGKAVVSKGKRFQITYASGLLKKYKIDVNGKLPTSYVYGKEPKMPQKVKAADSNILFMGWRYRVNSKKYKSGPTRTWYNARVTQFSKGLKGDVKVFPMVDKVMVRKNSTKKVVMVSKVLLKDYLTADSIDLGYISKDPGPRYLMFQARYADNKHMKNAKYLPLLSHEWTRRFALKNLKKGKVYYIQYRSIPFRYFGVPSETCWGQMFKVKIKE